MTFEEWLAKDEGVVKFGMELHPAWVDGARAGWDAATHAERERFRKLCAEVLSEVEARMNVS